MRTAHSSKPSIEAIRGALIDLRRLLQRRDLVRLWAKAVGGDAKLDYAELRLLDAVRVASGAGTTVGHIATILGIDPSRASRQVARAVKKGLLRRAAAQTDGRKVLLEITPRGAQQQTAGGNLTRARIERAVATWSARDRAQFATLFARFASGMLD
jgi:DNA-binding MarR family transcriptional regulator